MQLPTDNAGRTRLLPGALPLRFFAAAAVFQAAAWLLLAATGLPPPRSGGLGPAVAALHLFTLGSLGITVVGASLQLLPVALVQSAPPPALVRGLWWLLVPGVAVLAAGMAWRSVPLAIAGALPVVLGLGVHALLLARLLAAARRQRALTAHGWLALSCLLGVLATGPVLLLHYRFGWPLELRGLALAHFLLGSYGFMGLLASGLSYLLVPMFVVARGPDEATQRRVLGVLVLALGGAVALVWSGRAAQSAPGVAALGLLILLGLGAAVVHVRALVATVRRRRNREAPWIPVLMFVAWAGLLASLLLGFLLAAALFLGGAVTTDMTDVGQSAWATALVSWQRARPGPMLVALVLLAWLQSFTLAMLLRIVPFLSAVHARVEAQAMPPLRSLVSPLLAWSLVAAHLSGLAGLLYGLAAGQALGVRLAGLIGAAGALALLGFILSMRGRALQQARVLTNDKAAAQAER